MPYTSYPSKMIAQLNRWHRIDEMRHISSSLPKKIVNNTAEIAKGVFQQTYPYLVSISPFYLSRMTEFRAFSSVGLVTGINSALTSESDNLPDALFNGVHLTANLIGLADLVGMLPAHTEARIAIEGLFLISSSIGSAQTLKRGYSLLSSGLTFREKGIIDRVQNCASGTILTLLSSLTLKDSVQGCKTLLHMSKHLPTSVSDQLMMKHRAFNADHSEDCGAVFLDGMYEGKNFQSRIPSTFAMSVSTICETKFYSAHSEAKVCAVLQEAKETFGKPIDILGVTAHASENGLKFENSFQFSDQKQVLACMQQTLSPKAQVFLLGCNTATPKNDGELTITEKLAQALPGKEVTGYDAYYNPLFTTTTYSEGTLRHENYLPFPSGFKFRLKTAVSFTAEKLKGISCHEHSIFNKS